MGAAAEYLMALGMERVRDHEAELLGSEARYRGLVDLAADAIVISAPDGAIVEANHRASELTGRTRQDLASHSSFSIHA